MISYEIFFYAKLKEALITNRSSFQCKSSKFILIILNLLQKRGYIKNYREIKLEDNNFQRTKKYFSKNLLEVQVSQFGGEHLGVQEFTIFSTPGRSIFVSYKDIRKYSRIKSLLVLSTPYGLLIGQEAIKRKVGGKLLFRIT